MRVPKIWSIGPTALTTGNSCSLSNSERTILIEIEDAMGRLDNGGYGVCNHCEETITARRLQAVPWARYCVGCQELSEQGMLYEN